MANILCPNPPQTCVDLPLINFSSETVDRERFIGRRPVNPDPPLGHNWSSSGCIGTCESTISQEDADNCAQRQSTLCLCVNYSCGSVCPDGSGPPCVFPPTTPPTNTTPIVPWANDTQEASFTCPDGSQFFFTVPAGTVLLFSKAAANAAALSMAINGAIANRICIGELAKGACVGSPFVSTVAFSSPLAGLPGTVVDVVVQGQLPPGLGLVYGPNEFAIQGTPSTVGTYIFPIKVSLTPANSVTTHFAIKSYTLYVIEIVQSSLAAGTVGTAYSQQLTTNGPTSGVVTWAVTSGTLPPGLTLSAAGLISGSPTTAGSYPFTISATDERPVACSKDFSLAVAATSPCAALFNDTVWVDDGSFVTFNGVSSGVSFVGSHFEGTADSGAYVAGESSGAQIRQDGTFLYTGPQVDCCFVISSTYSGPTPPGSFSLLVTQDAVSVLQLVDATSGSFPLTLLAGVGSVILIEVIIAAAVNEDTPGNESSVLAVVGDFGDCP